MSERFRLYRTGNRQRKHQNLRIHFTQKNSHSHDTKLRQWRRDLHCGHEVCQVFAYPRCSKHLPEHGRSGQGWICGPCQVKSDCQRRSKAAGFKLEQTGLDRCLEKSCTLLEQASAQMTPSLMLPRRLSTCTIILSLRKTDCLRLYGPTSATASRP